MSKQIVEIGDRVIFVDPVGKTHQALVTAVWGNREFGEGVSAPSVNVVFVSEDETKTDTYGRQMERQTSVCHESVQPAHGMKWFIPQ